MFYQIKTIQLLILCIYGLQVKSGDPTITKHEQLSTIGKFIQ